MFIFAVLYVFAVIGFVILMIAAACGVFRQPDMIEPSRFDGRIISDEEFLAACLPGTRPEVALKVRAIVSEQLCIPENELHPSHRFVEDLRAD